MKNVYKYFIAAIGFGMATLAGLLTLLLLLDGFISGWIRIILIAVAFFAMRLYLYNSNLKVYFDDIQG